MKTCSGREKKSICRRPEGTRQSHGAHVCGLRRRLGHVACASGRLVHQASIHPSAAAAMPRRTFVNKCYVQRRVPAAAVVSPGLEGFQIGSNLKFKFEFKKIKKSQKILKILQVATNLMVSIFFKYSFI